jgi:hypothetical protein
MALCRCCTTSFKGHVSLPAHVAQLISVCCHCCLCRWPSSTYQGKVSSCLGGDIGRQALEPLSHAASMW